MNGTNQAGHIGWIDLTTDDAEGIREFYQEVVGWHSSSVDMGDYDDHCMIPADVEDAVAGICHKRGSNSNMPDGWMIYITVDDLDASQSKCRKMGGKIIIESRNLGGTARFCVIEDPSGATCALFENKGE